GVRLRHRHDGSRARKWVLCQRSVKRRLRRFADGLLPHVTDHADDRHFVLWIWCWIAGGELHADGIASLEIALDEHLVDDRDRRRGGKVSRSEVTSLDERRAHRREETRADEALSRARRIRRVERLSMKLRQE